MEEFAPYKGNSPIVSNIIRRIVDLLDCRKGARFLCHNLNKIEAVNVSSLSDFFGFKHKFVEIN